MGNKRFQHSNFKNVFGELQSVHRVKREKFEIIVIPAVLFFLFLFGVVTYIAAEDWLALPVCVVIPFLLFCGVVWQLLRTRRDELRIYESGFTYQSDRNLQTCLWHEVKVFRRREFNQRELSALEGGKFPLASVEKKDGEVIAFDHDLTGTSELCFLIEHKTRNSR